MFCMQRVAQICTSKTGALSVWRTKEDMPPMYRALLPPQDETKIKEVMRFAGPRMIWYHPIWTLKHLWRER